MASTIFVGTTVTYDTARIHTEVAGATLNVRSTGLAFVLDTGFAGVAVGVADAFFAGGVLGVAVFVAGAIAVATAARAAFLGKGIAEFAASAVAV